MSFLIGRGSSEWGHLWKDQARFVSLGSKVVSADSMKRGHVVYMNNRMPI